MALITPFDLLHFTSLRLIILNVVWFALVQKKGDKYLPPF